MRIVLVVVLVGHGLLNLLGFVKQWGLASLPQLRGDTLLALRGVGVLWALACLALLGAAVMVALDRERWWIPAAAGIVLSQLLIVNAWSDARAGTIVNLLLVLPVVVAAAQARFHRGTDDAVLRLLASVPAGTPAPVTAAELQPLPPPVRRWLETSGVVGRDRARVVRLEQRGWLRTAPDQAWMPARARQHFTVDEPGFVWSVDVVMKRLLPVVGRDTYQSGHGRMLIKAGGLVTVADASGPKVDQGTLLRYLGEIVWFPSAALAPYIRWEAVDASSARATMTHAGVSASALFTFDGDGRMVRMTAQRYLGAGADARLQRWEAPARAWRRMDGILIPVEGSVIWKLASGDFDYYRWEITQLEINKESP
jgi:hypothetical protein